MNKEFEKIMKEFAASRRRTKDTFFMAMEYMLLEMERQTREFEKFDREVEEEQAHGARLTKHRISL